MGFPSRSLHSRYSRLCTLVTLNFQFLPYSTRDRERRHREQSEKNRYLAGLGMPIAKKIIEGHQGRIDIATQMGVGTEMIIELPYQSTEKRG